MLLVLRTHVPLILLLPTAPNKQKAMHKSQAKGSQAAAAHGHTHMHQALAPTKAKKKKTAPTAEQMHKPLQEGVPAGRQRWARRRRTKSS